LFLVKLLNCVKIWSNILKIEALRKLMQVSNYEHEAVNCQKAVALVIRKNRTRELGKIYKKGAI
jgi:hypothetical protein